MSPIDILKLYFKHEKINNVDNELLKELKDQNLLQYLYYVLDNDINVNRYYLKCTIIQEKFLRLQNEISSILNKHNIKHMFIKGSVLCKLYPDLVLRTRGDIDLYIIDDKFTEAKEALRNAGYNEGVPCYHHTGFSKNGLEVELHNHLLSLEYENNSYFDDILKIENVNDSLYKLDESVHYLYEIWHLHKHTKSGEGLRYLLDFYYMQKNWNLDYNYIDNELSKYNLTRFHNSIINGVYIITNEKLHGFTDPNDDVLINYLNSCGIHGRATNPVENLVSANYTSKTKYILDRVLLLNKNERKNLYPKLSKSILLYPLLLTHRICHLIFKRFKSLNRVIKIKTMDSHKNILQEIGVVKL